MSGPHFLAGVVASDSAWGLRIERTGTWLATMPILAGSSASRRRGLLGRDAMALGEALIIAPTQGVHTFGMRFPIDLVGVSRDGRVVSVHRAVPRRRIVFSWKAFAIIELPGGATDQAGVVEGDRISAEPWIPVPRDICPAPDSLFRLPPTCTNPSRPPGTER